MFQYGSGDRGHCSAFCSVSACGKRQETQPTTSWKGIPPCRSLSRRTSLRTASILLALLKVKKAIGCQSHSSAVPHHLTLRRIYAVALPRTRRRCCWRKACIPPQSRFLAVAQHEVAGSGQWGGGRSTLTELWERWCQGCITALGVIRSCHSGRTNLPPLKPFDHDLGGAFNHRLK